MAHAKGMPKMSGFTIVEMMVTVVIVSMLMAYAWDIYFSGRETMRHGVSQSQMQTDARSFFDRLGREIPSVYRFIETDTQNTDKKTFSYYCFVTARTPIENILFNETTGYANSPNDQKFRVLRVNYEWEKSTFSIKRSQVLGDLYFRGVGVRRDHKEATSWC